MPDALVAFLKAELKLSPLLQGTPRVVSTRRSNGPVLRRAGTRTLMEIFLVVSDKGRASVAALGAISSHTDPAFSSRGQAELRDLRDIAR